MSTGGNAGREVVRKRPMLIVILPIIGSGIFPEAGYWLLHAVMAAVVAGVVFSLIGPLLAFWWVRPSGR